MAQIPLENLRTATPEKIWAILERSAKWQEEADRRREESDRRREEADRKYELQRKEFERKYELQRKEEDKRRKAEIAKNERERKEADERLQRQIEATDRQLKATERQVEQTSIEVAETIRQMKATDRQVEQTSIEVAETIRQMKVTDRQIKEANRRIGGIDNAFGNMVEHLVAPGIKKSLEGTGLVFPDTSQGRRLEENGRYLAEVDFMLENSEIIVAAEIKAKVTCEDIKDHRKRLEKIRRHFDGRGDRRKLYGAVAGAVFSAPQKAAALKAGFYVIVQSGDTMKLDMPEGYKPKAI